MASPRSRASQSHGRPKGSLKLSTDLAAVTTGRADDSYVDWERPVEQAFRRALREQNAERYRGAQLFSKKKNPDGSRLELVNRGQRADAAPLRQSRVPADQSNRSACQIIDRLKTTDDQVERVPTSGR